MCTTCHVQYSFFRLLTTASGLSCSPSLMRCRVWSRRWWSECCSPRVLLLVRQGVVLFRASLKSHTLSSSANNSASSGHFQTLLVHAARLVAGPGDGQAAANALHLCQVVLKFAAEHLTPERMLRLVAGPAAGAAAYLYCAGRVVLSRWKCSLCHLIPVAHSGNSPMASLTQAVVYLLAQSVTCVFARHRPAAHIIPSF